MIIYYFFILAGVYLVYSVVQRQIRKSFKSFKNREVLCIFVNLKSQEYKHSLPICSRGQRSHPAGRGGGALEKQELTDEVV